MDVASLIRKATTPPKGGENSFVVCSNHLSAIKSVCKQHPDAVKEAFYYLSVDLAKRNGVVRLRCLVIIDCLLHRSKVFRELVCADIRTIVGHMGLLNEEQTLTSSGGGSALTACAVELEAKGKELVEVWDHLYGDRHPQLRVVARYLREHLGLDMPNILENARLHAERTQRNRQHARNVVLLQGEKILHSEWSYYVPEWRKSLARLDEMFAILFPRFEDLLPSAAAAAGEGKEEGDGDEAVQWIDEDEDVQDREEASDAMDMAYAGAPYTLTIQLATSAGDLETADNAVLLQHIREIAKHLAKSAVPRLLHWRSVLAAAADLLRQDSEAAEATTMQLSEGAVADGDSDPPVGSAALPPPLLGLGKRSAHTAALDAPLPPPSRGGSSSTSASGPTLGAVESRLEELDALLGAIRSILTSKVKALLRGEQL